MKKYRPCTTAKILPLHNQKQSASLSVPHHPSHPCLHPLAKESSNPAATLPTFKSERCSEEWAGVLVPIQNILKDGMSAQIWKHKRDRPLHPLCWQCDELSTHPLLPHPHPLHLPLQYPLHSCMLEGLLLQGYPHPWLVLVCLELLDHSSTYRHIAQPILNNDAAQRQ